MSFAATLFAVPPEIIQHILAFCYPLEVSAFSRTCRAAYYVVYSLSDQYLWRELIIHHFDDPRKSLRCATSSTPLRYDWKAELQRRMVSASIVLNARDISDDQLRFALETFISIIDDASPIPRIQDIQAVPSCGLLWLTRLLHRSQILYRQPPQQLQQLVARLSVYFLFSDVDEDEECALITWGQRTESRCFTYDLRNYNIDNNWGPYLEDGSVNWLHIRHLMTVIWANLADLPERWKIVRPAVGLEATRAFSAPNISGQRDWAGVEGTWRRYVCFMDYRFVIPFCYFSNVFRGPRNKAYFTENVRFREATRLIEVKLKVVARDKLEGSNTDDDSTAHSPLYPPLYFNGISRGVDGNKSVIEGMVKMGNDGIVRYKFCEKVSIHDGTTQWSSEGVQVGSVASAAGVVGAWTTTVHDQGAFCPFWLWKVSDDFPTDAVVDYI
ncbi:uncharacterized protein BT62DRAFT_885214 [Guyanagaster necrorhizus]|uniref:F-box domain-containing protein n=1 Tax=Guyanagaster necrorhizus TaxID=856835 RepID=A0A9P8AXQ7_9AGAR|nr:uncharacterized protein BT62DRAFT_885214 [Guyanagaster necrorhizus MCA 3950]KAG7450187.1 hypothetical protein BT62DRAFT_885214 [Guyanagaster necrorhizus MCA 3950]